MKRLLLTLTLCLTAAVGFGDDFILNQGIATDHNGNKVRLNATKNSDGTYSLNIAGVTLQAGDITVNGGDASAANQTTQISAADALLASVGATTGAKVTTDANGTVQQYLRGLIYDWGQGLAVTGPLTNTQIRATPLPISGTVTATGPLTDTQLRASAVPVSGTVTATGPLTDTQLRATAVPISGTVTATGPLTDTQLRATAVPVTANAPTGTRVNSSAYEASHVLKNSAGTLISLTGYNSGPSQFILLFDSATVPANGASAVKVLFVPAQSNFSSDVPITGLPFSAGIAVSNSSTAPAKTIASTDVFFTAVVTQ